MKINSMQAPSTLIPEYIGSDFNAVLVVAGNIEAVKVVAENVDTFGVPLASETTTGIAEIATQEEVDQKTNDSNIVTPKKLGAYAAPLVHNHVTATPTESGFLAATDKQKLDGIAHNANNYTHPSSGVAPGTYKSVAVDANGHVTSGTNPNTIAGYGITDAVLSSDVVATATASKILKLDANSKLPASITGNAATATKLTTACTINGVSFDGSANITVNAVDSTSRVASSEKGVANGVATLGSDGKISSSQLPSYAGAVDSVAGKTGVVSLVKADVGLNNVDNTSDLNKPISTAQQSALDLKANLASPALTGTPSAPTAMVGTSTTQIATTAFVNAEIANDAALKSHVGATGTAHGVATTSVAGFMSPADKIKLDNISGVSVVSGVSSVNGKTGEVVLTKADVGLDLVNNTSDLDKPISTATQSALDSKYSPNNKPTAADVGLGLVNNTSDLNKPISTSTQTALDAKADTNHVHGVVTTSAAGFMSAADKVKLDGMASGGGYTHPASGVSPGTYKSVTVDGNGHITAGSNPTTLAGYGITDAVVNTTTINGKPLTTDITLTAADVGATGATVATPTTNGLMSSTDKSKLNGIATGANAYVHPTGDGSLHVPATGTNNNEKWLKAGATAGSLGWATISKTDVGLSNVDNTSDVNKPISTATQTALNSKEATIVLGTTTQYWRGDKSWQSLNKAAVGLGNVDNTTDLNKPISTATQTALDTKYSSTNKPTAADIGALAASDTAVAATKLATARTIAGISFDGTANINIAASNVGALPAAGGSISGNLFVDGTLMITNPGSMGLLNSFNRSMVRGSSTTVNVFGNTTDAMYFDGNSLTAWQVRYNSILYPIYHKGNKPTPADIGAQPATSDSRVKSNIASLSPVLDKIMLIDPKTFTMEGREGTCVGTIAQDWEVDFPEVILNVPSTAQGEPEMLKGIDALGTIGILLKAIQELKGELEDLKNR